MRFVNQKNLNQYIAVENMLTCWGGEDDYTFKFEDEKLSTETIMTTDENDNTTIVSHEKKVCVFCTYIYASN